MKNIKRIILMALTVLLAAGLVACKKDKEEDTVENISFLDYSVIRPDKTSEKLLDELSVMYLKLTALSGTDNVLASDWLEAGKEPDPEAKEILVGHTNRPETEQVLSQLAGDEYAIAVVGNKIIITGITDSITPTAVKYFVENYLGDGAEGTLPEDLFHKASVETALIVDKGEPVYTLVRSATADDAIVDMMYQVSDAITKVSGVTLPIKTDRLNNGQSYDSESYDILFGDTAYPQTQELKPNVAPDEYKIDFIENKIVIYAWNVEGIEKAVEAFANMLTYAYYTDADEKCTVCVVKETITGKNDSAGYYIDVPFEANGKRYNSVYDCYDGAMELYWSDAEESMVTSYGAALEGMGYSKHQELNNTSVSSATYSKNKASVHIYYLKNKKEFRVVTQDNATLPVNAYAYEKVCDPAVTQLGLDYTTNPDLTGGMGYLIRLEDGTFVVIDGGDNLDTNAANLYNLMVEQKPEGVEDIVISAWFMTHGHSDHYGVLRNFMANYNDKVIVKTLVGNDPPEFIHESCDTPGHPFIFNSVKGKFGGCTYTKAHTGQQFFFPGATFTIMLTHEDVFPQKPMEKFNSNASMAFDTVIEDKRFLWLGDMESEGAKLFKEMYYGDMKCDVLQIAHHGVKGATIDVYERCAPSIAFWPASARITNNSEWWNLTQNKFLRDTVEQMIIAKDGNYTIWFGEQLDMGGLEGSLDADGDYSKFY